MPEAYIANAAIDDDRYYVPLSETVFSRPLWISPTQNRWCDILMAKRAGLVNRHYHPHQIFAYTISGKWGYLEHDWTATAGDFIYETPGESHTLVAYDHPDPMRVFFVVSAPLMWLDEDGQHGRLFRRSQLHRSLQGPLREIGPRRGYDHQAVSLNSKVPAGESLEMAGRFAGKSIVVTGGGGGIGRAACLAFAREGGGC